MILENAGERVIPNNVVTQREKELEKGGEVPEKFIQRITELAKLIPVTKSVHSSVRTITCPTWMNCLNKHIYEG